MIGHIRRNTQPHLQETFKLSTDPHFVDKVRDVVGLYMAPPDRALVRISANVTDHFGAS